MAHLPLFWRCRKYKMMSVWSKMASSAQPSLTIYIYQINRTDSARVLYQTTPSLINKPPVHGLLSTRKCKVPIYIISTATRRKLIWWKLQYSKNVRKSHDKICWKSLIEIRCLDWPRFLYILILGSYYTKNCINTLHCWPTASPLCHWGLYTPGKFCINTGYLQYMIRTYTIENVKNVQCHCHGRF